MSKVRLLVCNRHRHIVRLDPLQTQFLKIIEPFNIGVLCLFVEWLLLLGENYYEQFH